MAFGELVRKAARFLPSKKVKSKTSKEKGNELEDRVAEILRTEGRSNIRKNVMVSDKHGNRSEIDVMCGIFIRRCYECKNYGPGHTVPLEDVAKFKEVLSLNGFPMRFATFVTTSTFTPRATTIGIRTIDGAQLNVWERKANRQAAMRRLCIAIAYALLLGTLSIAAAPSYVAAKLPAHETQAMKIALHAHAQGRFFLDYVKTQLLK
jgi:hypothetical protein